MKYFKIFRSNSYFPDDMRKSIPSPTSLSIDMPKPRLSFPLNIRNNLASSWKKSGQQAAFSSELRPGFQGKIQIFHVYASLMLFLKLSEPNYDDGHGYVTG